VRAPRNADDWHDNIDGQLVHPASEKLPQFAAVRQYAGQQMLTGDQAEVYADHFIANHLKTIGGGQTYAQLSGKALANPTDAKLQAQVATMFKGETLRGLLLNAYAFGTMGTIAGTKQLLGHEAPEVERVP